MCIVRPGRISQYSSETPLWNSHCSKQVRTSIKRHGSGSDKATARSRRLFLMGESLGSRSGMSVAFFLRTRTEGLVEGHILSNDNVTKILKGKHMVPDHSTKLHLIHSLFSQEKPAGPICWQSGKDQNQYGFGREKLHKHVKKDCCTYLGDHGKSQQVAHKTDYSYEDFTPITLPQEGWIQIHQGCDLPFHFDKLGKEKKHCQHKQVCSVQTQAEKVL